LTEVNNNTIHRNKQPVEPTGS